MNSTPKKFGYFSWSWLIKGTLDGQLLVNVYIVILVFIECVLIWRNHFWIWTGIALYGIATACICSTYSVHYLVANIKEHELTPLDTLSASVSYLLIVAPIAIYIYLIPEKNQRGYLLTCGFGR